MRVNSPQARVSVPDADAEPLELHLLGLGQQPRILSENGSVLRPLERPGTKEFRERALRLPRLEVDGFDRHPSEELPRVDAPFKDAVDRRRGTTMNTKAKNAEFFNELTSALETGVR